MPEFAPSRLPARGIGIAAGMVLLVMLAIPMAGEVRAAAAPAATAVPATAESTRPGPPQGEQGGEQVQVRPDSCRTPQDARPGVGDMAASMLMPVLLLLLLVAGNVWLGTRMSSKKSADKPKMPARHPREEWSDDRRLHEVDKLLSSVQKKWGILIFFCSGYVIVLLYMLAPLLARSEPMGALQFVAAALAPPLTVASIYFVVRQLRKNEEATWSTTVEHVHSRMHDIHRIFLDQPGLRPYFYENEPVPVAERSRQAANDKQPRPKGRGIEPQEQEACAANGEVSDPIGNERARVLVMAELICDYFEQIIWHHRYLPTIEAREGWTVFMRQMFQGSPALRSHLWNNRRMYPEELASIAGVGAGGLISIIVHEPDDPWLSKGHAKLDAYFGPHREMEALEQLRERLSGNEAREAADGFRIVYEMMLVVDAGEIVAAGDYCAIVPQGGWMRRKRPPVGFLSHVWVTPEREGQGLSRKFHERLAELVRETDKAKGRQAVFVAEAERLKEGDQERSRRLAYFKKVGYLQVDPGKVDYLQPDFGPYERGEASRPVPLLLLLRDVAPGRT